MGHGVRKADIDKCLFCKDTESSVLSQLSVLPVSRLRTRSVTSARDGSGASFTDSQLKVLYSVVMDRASLPLGTLIR